MASSQPPLSQPSSSPNSHGSKNSPHPQQASDSKLESPKWSQEQIDCCVLVIPLVDGVTPTLISRKFVRYGELKEVRPVDGSSSCIARFGNRNEASQCIQLFKNHKNVRVTAVSRYETSYCARINKTKENTCDKKTQKKSTIQIYNQNIEMISSVLKEVIAVIQIF